MMLSTAAAHYHCSRACFFPNFSLNLHSNYRRRRVGAGLCKATLITNSDAFEVGRLIGSYGFMTVTSYSGFELGTDVDYLPRQVGSLMTQDVGEGSVKIRLYQGRIAQGPLKGTPVLFKVYPGKQVGGLEADLMATNELSAHASLQSNSKGLSCQNIQTLLGGFETQTGEQWLAFQDNGKYTAADYAKAASAKMSKYRDIGVENFWNPFERDVTMKRRRYFVAKLLQGAIKGLAFMHDHDRLHQSLGPSSIVLQCAFEKFYLNFNKSFLICPEFLFLPM